jgi:hypothetical protein
MSQDKGPIYNAPLPESLPLFNGFSQAVPRRDELMQVRKTVGDRTVGALEVALTIVAAIDRSGFDLSQCMDCGTMVVCIPDGQAMCEACATKAGGS